MKFFAFSVVAAVAGIFSAAVVAADDSDVVTLTKDTFNDFVKGEDLSLVEFYAPWCGHCKALAPEYEVAATTLSADKIKIAKVDCTVETDICSGQDVRGYPTLKVFRKGTPADYKGQRKADAIISYMKKQALPALSELKAADIAEFTKKDKVVVVGYFSDKVSKKYKAYAEVAEALRDDYVFGFTNDAVDDAKAPAVVLYKTFDEGKNVFDGKYNTDALTAFVKTSATPLMDDVGPENYQTYVSSGLPLAYLFVKDEEQRKSVGPAVEAAAKKYKGKLNFVYIDAAKYGAHASNLNLKADKWPAFAIQEPAEQLKFPYSQEKKITKDSIDIFVKSYLAKEIQPDLKSEEAPAKNDGPVKVVVGKNFKEIVMDEKKDVFLEVYAPWCGHCKKLAPIWDELGTLLKKDSDLVTIAKMDGTENDLPLGVNFQIPGFPTLKLFKAGTNEIVDFDGERDLESLLKFVKEKGANGKKLTGSVPSSPDDEDKDEEDDDEEDEDDHAGHDHDEL